MMSTPQEADGDFIAEALPVFVNEANEQLQSIEQLLLELEESPNDRKLLDELFRCAHTVKGSAGIFGLDAVVGFTHHVETLLDRMRSGEVALTEDLSTLLLRCNDEIRRLVACTLNGETPELDDERDALVAQMKLSSGQSRAELPVAAEVASSKSTTEQAHRCLLVAFGADTFRDGMDPLAILSYMQSQQMLHAVECDPSAVPTIQLLDPEACHLIFLLTINQDVPTEQVLNAFSFVRDETSLDLIACDATDAELEAFKRRLTALSSPLLESFNRWWIGHQAQRAEGAALYATADAEVVTSSTQGTSRAARAIDVTAEDQRFIRVQADRLDSVINLLGELVIASAGASMLARQTRQGTLIEANQQITRLIEEIRNGTLQLRMVPIGETFSRFRRVIRDTASQLNKEVSLQVVGGDTELDKSVVERIADPLMHLVRNALDHGLEGPEERVAAGKPRQGQISLSACHESGSILIRISDDGRGISRARVLSRAWDRGLVERGVTPPDAEILKLIFEPGFSTAEQVTNLSGRGVGMDVVRRNIEALRGAVSVSSIEGKGSTIEIRLPLTLAIIDGFLVGVGSSKFIFPLESVVEVIERRLPASSVDSGGRCVVELRGQPLPVVSLRTLYALDDAEPDRTSVVVIQCGSLRYGVAVDQLMGQHQTVIKPLGRMFRSLRGMSGSSILGNGEVALIFDVNSLGQLAAEQRRSDSTLHGVLSA